MLMHRPQTPQPGFGPITVLQKFTPNFKILDPRLPSSPAPSSPPPPPYVTGAPATQVTAGVVQFLTLSPSSDQHQISPFNSNAL